jgi:hypothetical protein
MTMTEQYQIQEYTQTAAALALLNEKYSGQLFAVTTTQGMDEAKKARAEVKGYRVALEKLRVELKAPALERTRLIDAEAKRITAELLAIEAPIDQQIKEEERRKEEEKAEEARAEAACLASIAAKISAIRNRVTEIANQNAVTITLALEKVENLELAPEDFEEFMPDALAAQQETVAALKAALDARIAYELEQARLKEKQAAEAARIAAEREELAKLREAEAARKAEEARIAAEAKAKANAEAAEIHQKQEAEAARIAAAQQELDERQRKIEEAEAEAKAKAEAAAKAKTVKPIRKSKAIADPIADLKQAINANLATAKALDEAYQRGFQAGLNSAQQAA